MPESAASGRRFHMRDQAQLIRPSEDERRRVSKLFLCQIGRKFGLAADLDLIYRHGDELVTETQEASHRRNYRGHSRMVEFDQHVFDLADGCVALVHLTPDQLARPGASRQRRVVDARYRCRNFGFALLLSMGRREGQTQREQRDRGWLSCQHLSQGTGTWRGHPASFVSPVMKSCSLAL